MWRLQEGCGAGGRAAKFVGQHECVKKRNGGRRQHSSKGAKRPQPPPPGALLSEAWLATGQFPKETKQMARARADAAEAAISAKATQEVSALSWTTHAYDNPKEGAHHEGSTPPRSVCLTEPFAVRLAFDGHKWAHRTSVLSLLG